MQGRRKKPHDGRTRRDLLEWLGGGVAVSLLSPLLGGCGDGSGERGVDGGPIDIGTWGDARRDTTDAISAEAPPAPPCESGTFAEGPGDGPIFDKWYENTVDPQDTSSLIASWSLAVSGLVDAPRSFSFCELRDMPLVRQVTDFHCVEGWTVQDVPWDGVLLSTILSLVAPKGSAGWLKITAVGGSYSEALPIDVARESKTLLAIGIGGNALPLAHGFPCRIVVPRLYGYKNAKYVERIELVTDPWIGYWERFGYTITGEVDPARLRPGHY